MSDEEFRAKRRQIYLDEESYLNTLIHHQSDFKILDDNLAMTTLAIDDRASSINAIGSIRWNAFQLHYTAGENLDILAAALTDIVDAYERYLESWNLSPAAERYDPFRLVEMVDMYVDYLHLLSAAICLHREDLIPRIYGLVKDSPYDGTDAVIEDLLRHYLPDRVEIDEWFYDKPYTMLLDAIDGETPEERAKDMKKYVKNWYKSMKGQAHFWGKHEQIKPEFSPYYGYWAMCAAAFTYLYEIDDSSYRDEIVYPKDLADYARSKPRRTAAEAAKLVPLELMRCEAGKPCPRAGYWMTPGQDKSRRLFKKDDPMPSLAGDYGVTIWQWCQDQAES